MPLKVCEIVSAHMLIRTKEDDGSWAIERSKSSIFLIVVAESNLHIFRLFLKRWSRLSRLYNSCHRKYRARAHLVEVRSRWRIDRGADDESTCQGDRRRDQWKRHLPRWRSRIRGSFFRLSKTWTQISFQTKDVFFLVSWVNDLTSFKNFLMKRR